MLKLTLAAIMLVTPMFLHAAQKKRPTRGPVVAAYLANLQEELNELDFQLRHQEISRRDYERARARLMLQQHYVDYLAAESGEDVVPEMQVLSEDEFGALMLGAQASRGELRVGEVLAESWKVVGIEQRGEKFIVLKREAQARARAAASGQLSRRVNPLDVIETVRIEEPEEKTAATNRAVIEAAPVKIKTSEAPPAVERHVEEVRPQVRALYLPRYTAKAREKGVEGKVILNVLFGRDGKVRDVAIESRLGYGLDENALAAAKQIIFEPARQAGRPVDVRAQVIFTFAQNNVIARIQPLPAAEKSSEGKGN